MSEAPIRCSPPAMRCTKHRRVPRLTGFGPIFLERWTLAWLVTWATMLPVVILVAPLIERPVRALTAPDRDGRREPTG
jgi:hypothetical protein